MKHEEPQDGDNLPPKHQVELVADGEGLAVIGKPNEVKKLLQYLGLYERSVDITGRIGSVLRTGADLADTAATMSAHSGRWVKLTAESAAKMKAFGLTDTQMAGISWAMLGKPGKIREWLQIETGPGSRLTNPAILTDLASILGKMARQHDEDAIKTFLERIERKSDKIIHSVHATQWAQLGGAGDVLRRANSVREVEGALDPTTWSQVTTEMHHIYAVQQYALGQLGDVAQEAEAITKPRELARALQEAESHVRQCLAMLAYSFDLSRAFDDLELDRVRRESPEGFAQRRSTLEAIREGRRDEFAQTAAQLISRLEAAADQANLKVLLHQPSAKKTVRVIGEVGIALDDYHEVMGIEGRQHGVEALRWWHAVRSSKHLKEAGTEAGQLVIKGLVGTAAAVVGSVAFKAITNDTKSAD